MYMNDGNRNVDLWPCCQWCVCIEKLRSRVRNDICVFEKFMLQ